MSQIIKGIRKIEGVVSGNKRYAEGTITVLVTKKYQHPKFGKIVSQSKKYIVQHDEKTPLAVGKKVLITPCAPISKRKSFRILEVLSDVNKGI